MLLVFKILVRQPNLLKFSGSYVYNGILLSLFPNQPSFICNIVPEVFSSTLTWVEIDLSLWLHHNCSPLFYCIQYNLIFTACPFPVFNVEAQSPILCPSPVLSCPTKVLLCLPLLSVGLQVGSASGWLWKTGAWEEGEARGISPSPICLRGWWWSQQQLQLLCECIHQTSSSSMT